ncbi:1-(5-phosphoribosyl)-5-[(5-phosphoribosylamino)methylideneamino] imidazole-4-carboxamide isomerase [Labeo rohita]|uniref:1-(5-phosphoribosyl)-5-[(5-phosphoribosylamino)methylideneamino] imidazole-4-carboxamide isomerase n=1 Tax=Labeo rohita TaxID=84645 RepID=A0ABQ8M2Y4_LABRO|nr:1-(5-phosphoribosyl)-5-[(5-phosphoribosylamino)methylideneamino] imidazole-4-carboxamide isomerase [Labeo rohita]
MGTHTTFKLDQKCPNLVLKGRCPADFSSNHNLDTSVPANQALTRHTRIFPAGVLRQVGQCNWPMPVHEVTSTASATVSIKVCQYQYFYQSEVHALLCLQKPFVCSGSLGYHQGIISGKMFQEVFAFLTPEDKYDMYIMCLGGDQD